MQWNISQDQQNAIRQSSLELLERELFGELTVLGIDPLTYDVNNLPEFINTPEMEMRRTRLVNLTERLASLKEQIENAE